MKGALEGISKTACEFLDLLDSSSQESSKLIDRIGHGLGQDQLKELTQFHKDIRTSIGKQAKIISELANKPYQIGVFGHVSHGKSKLLGSLLVKEKLGEKFFPVGKGRMSARGILALFSKDDQPLFYAVKQSSITREEITEAEYRDYAIGTRADQIDYLRVEIPMKLAPNNELESFISHHIQLIDTPGIGDIYWDYGQRLMKEADLAILCIKGTEAGNDSVKKEINEFVKAVDCPIIPVITFWDSFLEDGQITDDLAEAKARETVARELQDPSSCMEPAVFVSALSCAEKQPPPEGVTGVSPEWNIDKLRSMMIGFAHTARMPTEEFIPTSKLQAARIEAAKRACRNIQGAIPEMLDRTRSIFNKAIPSELYEDVEPKTQGYLKRLDERRKDKASALARAFSASLDKHSNNRGLEVEAWRKAYDDVREEFIEEINSFNSQAISEMKHLCDEILRSRSMENHDPHVTSELKKSLNSFISYELDTMLDKQPRWDNLLEEPPRPNPMVSVPRAVAIALRNFIYKNLLLSIFVGLAFLAFPFLLGKLISSGVGFFAVLALAATLIYYSHSEITKQHRDDCRRYLSEAKEINQQANIESRWRSNAAGPKNAIGRILSQLRDVDDSTRKDLQELESHLDSVRTRVTVLSSRLSSPFLG